MEDIRRWDTMDVLDGVDELLNSGVAPGQDAYSLEEILKSMNEVNFYSPGKVAAPRPKVLSRVGDAPIVLSGMAEEKTAAPRQEPKEQKRPQSGSERKEEGAEWERFTLDELIEEYASVPKVDSQSYTLDDILREFQSGSDAPAEGEEEQEAADQAPAEEAPEAPEQEEAPSSELDMEEMAAFIGQNVSNVMGPEEEPAEDGGEDPLDGLMERFRSRGSRLKEMFRAGEKTDSIADAVAEEEPPVPDNISQMPTPKMKLLRDSLGKLQDKMDDFADQMYSEALTEEDDLEDGPIPETDTEEIPTEKEPRPSLKEKLGSLLEAVMRPVPKAPDLPPDVLARRYKLGMRFMSRRLGYVGFLLFIALYFTLAAETKLPIPFLLALPRVSGAILTWLLGMSCAAGLDVLWLGMTAPFRKQPGMHTLTAAAVFATLLDGIYFTAVGREGPLPFSALAILGIYCSMRGALWRKETLYRSCQAVARCAEPQRVTLDKSKWNGKPSFFKLKGSSVGFGSQIQSVDGAARIYRLWVPVIGVAAVLGAMITTVGHGQTHLFTWALSGILVACAPLSGLMAFAHPYARLGRRLDRSGAVIAGWEGAESMSGKANIVLTDVDLFPEGTVSQRSVAQGDGVPLEKITACVASILYAAGSGLYHLFDNELRRQGGSYRRVDDLQFYEVGGFSADIRGEQVLVGSYAFLNVMGISVPEGQRVRNAVYCAINKRLSGIFFLDYSMHRNDNHAVRDLVHSGIDPVLATRDFNVIPTMLLSLFDLPTERMEYPRLDRRRALSDPEHPHNPVLGAVVIRDNLSAYADAVIGGRRLTRIVKINAVIAVLASLVGLGLGIFLTWTAAFTSLTPLSMLLFLLIWAVPNVAISGAADKF